LSVGNQSLFTIYTNVHIPSNQFPYISYEFMKK
jgi:hypothetical protein